MAYSKKGKGLKDKKSRGTATAETAFTPVTVAIPLDDLQLLYEKLIEARDCAVPYNHDQLEMASAVIRKMNDILEPRILYLWNKINGIT